MQNVSGKGWLPVLDAFERLSKMTVGFNMVERAGG